MIVKNKVIMDMKIIRKLIMDIPNNIKPNEDPAINKIKLLNFMDKTIKYYEEK